MTYTLKVRCINTGCDDRTLAAAIDSRYESSIYLLMRITRMTYEYVQPTNYCGDEGNTEVFLYKDETGLTIDTEINTPRLTGKGVYVHQAVIAVLPDSEAIKLRDALIEMYPIKEQKQ